MSDFQRSALFPAQDALSLETKSALLASASLQDGLKDGLQPSQRASSAIVFIDANVTDYQSLAAGVTAGAEVYILDPMQDAVAQITNTLMGRTGIESLHIVSHGAAGSLQLGSDSLSLATLPGLASQLQSWGTALTDAADIMLYGCNVAEGELGQAFVQIMSQLTGADVAASDDITGQGGNWMMEVHTGVIESSLTFSSSTTQSYGSALAINVALISDRIDSTYQAIINQLNDDTYFDFNAVIVNPGQVDTVAELNAFNAVIVTGFPDGSPSNVYSSALRTWVEAGGGVVGTTWIVFKATDNNINTIIPVNTDSPYTYNVNPTLTITSSNHPVTTGVTSFVVQGLAETPSSSQLDAGATLLGTINSQPAVVVNNVGTGRSVYLGPSYGYSDSNATQNMSTGPADRLLEQAVAWVATRNVAKTGNEDTTITFSSTDFTNNFNNLTSLTVTSLPSNGTLQLNGSNVNVNQQITTANLGGLTFIPNTNFSGAVSFNWTGTDGTQSRNGAVDIVVNPIADQPTLSVQAASGNEDTSVLLTISSALVDTDGSETLSIAISGLPQGATLFAGTNNNGTWTLTPAQLQGLALTPAADYNGSFNLTIVATSTDGQSTAQNSQTLSVTINPVNDVPGFTAADPAASNEDANTVSLTNWATFTAGPADEASQTDTYTVSNISNPSLFETAPTINADGTLTYKAAANAVGTSTFTVAVQDSGGTANGGVDTSATQTFTITVNGVNDAPTFTATNPVASNEDAGTQTITNWATFNPGPSDEASQTATYIISNISNPSLFSVAPTVSANGTLSYTAAPNASGTSTFTVAVQDSGGTANGGVDTSATQTFTITVNPVNDAPTFTATNPVASSEDGGTQTVTNWATFNPGPSDEASQTATYIVSNISNSSLFEVAPSIDANGTLTYRAAANASGTSTFTIAVQDNGGTANGGVDTSATQTFTITVNPVNDAPTFTATDPAASDEDGGTQTVTNWATFNPGPSDEASQTATYIVSNISNSSLFEVAPSIDANGTLTYRATANASGTSTFTVAVQDSGGTANGGIDTSATQTFTITVNPVNDAPTFTATDPAASNEDGGTQTITNWATFTPGPADEANQTATYIISNISNPSLFSVAPTVSANGTLSYTAAPNASGTSTFTVAVQDNGGTANGGVDTSATQTFTITVDSVNDAPTFAAADPAAINEDADTVSLTNWATFNPGSADEANQTANYIVSNISNPNLFETAPSIDAKGTLTYKAAANAIGTSTFTIAVQDNGGTANGGVDTSATQTFTITVNPVNDAPTFTATDPATSNEDGGAQTIANWATFTPGPADETSQTATYTVSNISNPNLFSVAPTVSANGTLSYTAAPNASGTSTFTVAVQDNGGTANGGVDTSATQTFTITVNGVNDAPTIVAPTNLTTLANVARPITGITFSDIDAASGSITVAFAIPAGTLAATSASGVTVGGTPNALTLNGTLAEVNAFIAAGNLTYRGAAPGSQQLNVGITDGGNTGTGGAQTANTTVTLNIRSSNSDFNNDGQADLVWQNINNNGVSWLMNGTAINGVVGFPAPPSTDWYIGGIGDFDRDGDADIFWRSDVSGANGLWLMNGIQIVSVISLDRVTDTNWVMSGVGDFNGDGSLDMVWRNQVTGGNGIWLMNGTAIAGVTGLPTFGGAVWAIQGIGDFNSDGQADIVWQNLNNGSSAAWLMNGISYNAAVVLPTLPANWEIAGVTDFNNDGRSDLLVRNYGNGGGGGNGIWLMNGTAISALVGLDAVPDTNWIVNV